MFLSLRLKTLARTHQICVLAVCFLWTHRHPSTAWQKLLFHPKTAMYPSKGNLTVQNCPLDLFREGGAFRLPKPMLLRTACANRYSCSSGKPPFLSIAWRTLTSRSYPSKGICNAFAVEDVTVPGCPRLQTALKGYSTFGIFKIGNVSGKLKEELRFPSGTWGAPLFKLFLVTGWPKRFCLKVKTFLLQNVVSLAGCTQGRVYTV